MVHGDGPARCNRSCLFSTNLNDLTFMILVDPLLTYYFFSFDLTEIPLILSLGISSAKKAKGQFKGIIADEIKVSGVILFHYIGLAKLLAWPINEKLPQISICGTFKCIKLFVSPHQF